MDVFFIEVTVQLQLQLKIQLQFLLYTLKEFHDMRSWNFVQVGELNNHGNTLDNQMQKCKGILSLDRIFLFPTKVFLSNKTIISKCLAAWNVIL